MAIAQGAPIRCLVIQLTRLGDTLQSLMALRAAQQLYPQLEIYFVARERFADAAKRVPWIKKVITLPTDSLLGPLVAGEKGEEESLADLARWIAPLVKDSWDFVVNWSYSESSSYLTALLPAHVKLGYSRRRDTGFLNADGWSHYVQAIVQGGVPQNIHLTDIFTTQLLTALQIHVGEPTENGNSTVTSKSFFSLELGARDLEITRKDSTKKWVAIQLGAGQDAKTYAPESWARIASMLLQRHPEIHLVLLGGKAELNRQKRFLESLESFVPAAAARKRVLSLVGQTDFDLWASVVGRSQWLLSGDTAAIHLASVLGTRVLNVSVGPVVWTETGPYGNGHYVVSPAQPCSGCASHAAELAAHTCHEQIAPEAVYAAWAYASTEWSHRRQLPIEKHFSELGYTAELQRICMHRSRIRGTQDGGGVVYESQLQRPSDLTQWTSMVMGHVARAWYCGWVPPVGQELTREKVSPALIQKLRELEESTQVMKNILRESARVALELNQKSTRLKSNSVMELSDRKQLFELGRQLQELDSLMDRLAVTHRSLLGFVQMAKVLMHNLSGNRIAELGKESAECYKQLSEGVSVMRDWLRHTLQLARPVAVARAPIAALPKEIPQ